jgi:hypothetical protein
MLLGVETFIKNGVRAYTDAKYMSASIKFSEGSG